MRPASLSPFLCSGGNEKAVAAGWKTFLAHLRESCSKDGGAGSQAVGPGCQETATLAPGCLPRRHFL